MKKTYPKQDSYKNIANTSEEATFEVEIDNCRVVAYSNIHGDRLVPGDIYIANRGNGWHMAEYASTKNGYVVPKNYTIYPYTPNECCKVKEVVDLGEGQ